MKFQCQQCKTRYSIADEKVRGKILKIRCKNCEAIITVREGMGVDEGEEKRTGATVALTVPKLPDDLEAEVKAAVAADKAAKAAKESAAKPERGKSGSVAAPPIPVDRNETLALAPVAKDKEKNKKRKGSKSGVRPLPTSGRAGSKAEPFPRPDSAAKSKADSDALEDEWFVSSDGEQAGPFTLEQARERVKKKKPDEDLHAWRDGFDEWLPVENIAEFRGVVPRTPSKERLPIQPAADDDEGMGGESAPNLSGLVRDNLSPDGGFGEGRRAAAADEDSNLDFDIGEASRVVRMPMLAPGMGSAGASLGPAGLPGMGGGGLPAAPGATAMHGTNGAARAAALLERAQQSRIEPPKRKSRAGVLLAAVGALVIVAGGSGVLWYTTRDDTAGRVGRDGFAVGPDVYDQGYLPGQNRPVAKDGKPLPSGAVGGKVGGRPRQPGAASGRPLGDGTIANPYGPGITGPQGGGVGGGNTGVDLNDDARPLTPDDVVMTAGNAANQTGIRLCYEHALKKDPTLAVARMNVTISINTDGVVTSVGMPKREQTQFLTNCLDSRIRRWRFRKSTEGLTAEFPLIFSKRS